MTETSERTPLPWLDHLGTALTLGYITLIAIGMFHNALRFSHFGLNILDFAEPSDFLLAPFRDPKVLLVTVLPMGLAWIYLTWVERVSDRRAALRRAQGQPRAWWEASEAFKARTEKLQPLMKLALGCFWLYVSASGYQRFAARAVMRGDGTRVAVTLTDGTIEQGTPTRPLSLIGTTGRFVFLFRTELWRVEIIPTDNVLRIIPDGALPPDMVRARERTLRHLDRLAAPARGP